MEASRWDRLEDFSRRLDRYEVRLREIEEDIELLGRVDERLKAVENKVDRCLAGTDALERAIQARDKAAAEEYKAQRRDATNTKRWILGSVIAASGVITGAVGLIVAILERTP